jgi:hypothetical protein
MLDGTAVAGPEGIIGRISQTSRGGYNGRQIPSGPMVRHVPLDDGDGWGNPEPGGPGACEDGDGNGVAGGDGAAAGPGTLVGAAGRGLLERGAVAAESGVLGPP